MTPFNHFLSSASLNTISPSATLSSPPSSFKILSGPKCDTIDLKPAVPGSTTSLARISASMIGILCCASIEETVDLPEAIPPVRPTTGVS